MSLDLKIKALSGKNEIDELKELAAGDNHEVLFPTHVAFKGGEVVGYVSMGYLPVVNVWAHSEKVRVRDSLQLLNITEHILEANGVRQFMMPCHDSSPYFPYMGKFGFVNMGTSTLQVKLG